MPRARRLHRIIRTNGQRIAYTNTSSIPDDELRAAIKWVAREVNLDRVVIHAKRAGKRRFTCGCAYSAIPIIANLDGLKPWQWDYLVIVTDARGEDWFDTLAHEAKHVEQFRLGLPVSELPPRAFARWAADSRDKQEKS
jgi:hypothetical protein